MTMASFRHMMPRAGLSFHSRQLQHRLLLPSVRHASTSNPTPPKPRLLEKPERFNPPSHPSRLRSKPRAYTVPLSEAERQAQKTRRYPHMMPPEGSFMYWFLTNKLVHVWITFTVLFGLVFYTWYLQFVNNTPYRDLLPPKSLFYSHPFVYLRRYGEVYYMHVQHVSAETYERRRQQREDVSKRSEYRKAHGLDQDEKELGGWTARADAQVLGPGMREGGETVRPGPETTMDLARATVDNIEGKGEEATYVDFEGKRQPMRKKWFGIW